MTTSALQPDLDDLRGRVVGTVTGREDPGYDEARAVWNGMIDRSPWAVVRAAGVGDVAPTIRFARENRLDLAVRGGGHNVAGHGTVDDGLVLDMADLHAVAVDPTAAAVRVEAGATLAHVDAATEPHGLVVPIGAVSRTGIAGLTLGGGLGWLTRPYGLTADNLLSVELITADGEQVTAEETEHADLFWALHGGGGNFGVVTAFSFRAHPHGPQLFAGNLIYRPDRWLQAWAALEEWTRELPDAMTTIITTLTPPPLAELGDQPLMLVGFVWASPDHSAGEAEVERLRRLAPPDEEQVGDMRWVEWQSAFDPLVPRGVRAYWRNTSFDRLDDEVIEVLIRRGTEQTWTGTAFDVHHLGGAFARVPEEATPFPHRAARFWLNIYGFWVEPAADTDRTRFVRGLSEDMAPYATGGRYMNFEGQNSAGHHGFDPLTVFGARKYQRLLDVKRRYDPDNVFHVNQNLRPQAVPPPRDARP